MQTWTVRHLAGRWSASLRTGCPWRHPVLIGSLRALCACRWGSDATGEEAGKAGAATRRAPLGPRLTCALHRMVFMQGHTHPNTALSKARGRGRGVVRRMQIYALSLCSMLCRYVNRREGD